MNRQSISLTEPNNSWLKAQVESKEFPNKSEVVNDLIRRERLREQETERIRVALIEGEQSGYSELSVEEIWDQARNA